MRWLFLGMRILSCLGFFLLIMHVISAQETMDSLRNASDKGQQLFDGGFHTKPALKREPLRDNDDPVVDQQPTFPGGESALLAFLAKELHSPDSLSVGPGRTKVLVGFVVKADGSLYDAHVLRRVHPLLEEEAMRVVRAMPAWIPARKDGVPVQCGVVLPIIFSPR
jgi:TonB family protein